MFGLATALDERPQHGHCEARKSVPDSRLKMSASTEYDSAYARASRCALDNARCHPTGQGMSDKQAERPLPKKPYATPTLERYGGVSALTKAVNTTGKNADGGGGKTNKT
jgi:hypothetical protein